MVAALIVLAGIALGGDSTPPAALPPPRHGYPAHLPEFVLAMRIDPQEKRVTVKEELTWTHPGGPPVENLVIQAHAAFVLPESEQGAMAKTLEMLRLDPRDALGGKRPALEFQ
ncbi:MAG: hypothetical protein ACKO9Z_13145, partial [Planctomycetota bacterium]